MADGAYLFLDSATNRFYLVSKEEGFGFDSLPFDPRLELEDEDRLTKVAASIKNKSITGYFASRVSPRNESNFHSIKIATGVMNRKLAISGFTHDTYRAMVKCGSLPEMVRDWEDVQASYQSITETADMRAGGDAKEAVCTRTGDKGKGTVKGKGHGKSSSKGRNNFLSLGNLLLGGAGPAGGGGNGGGSDDEGNGEKRKLPQDHLGEEKDKKKVTFFLLNYVVL